MVIGGYNDDGRLSDVEMIAPFQQTSHCVDPQDLPQKSEKMVGEVINTVPMVCGGYVDSSVYSNKCFGYDNNVWTSRIQLQHPRGYAGSILLPNASGTQWWVSGGWGDSSSLTTSEVLLNINDDTFTMSSTLPEKMLGHCLSKINSSHIFIAGNDYDDLRMAYIVKTSIEPFVFTKLPPMLETRYYAACATITNHSPTTTMLNGNTQLMVAGGGSSTSTTSELYSLDAGIWKYGPVLPRGFANGGYINTHSTYPMIMVAGYDEGNNDRSDVMAYDPTTNEFKFLPGKLQTPRYALAVIGMETEEEC